MLWKTKTVDCSGSALFPGSMSPRLDELAAAFDRAGVTVTPATAGTGAHWIAELEHPAWGRAKAICLRNPPPLPREMVVHDARLSDAEREGAVRGQGSVSVTITGSHGGEEHLWFSINDLRDDGLEATLESQPFDIAAMKPGQRAFHPLERLGDWAILTPAGMITPRDTGPARKIRPHKERIRRAMAEQKGKGGQ